MIRHFLDSGAFTLWTKAAEYAKAGHGEWDYYDTSEFYEYLDHYVVFVKKYLVGIDYYANVDVIPNPELTWRNQQYLESKGLKPVPVVHCGTDIKWLNKYVKAGYDFIGIGGLVGGRGEDNRASWLDRYFREVCPSPKYLPLVKFHGFGVTGHGISTRYPWWSVDSTAWTKYSFYGSIIVPLRKGNGFDLSRSPQKVRISVSAKADVGRIEGDHYAKMNKQSREWVESWLDHIEIPLGKAGPNEEVIESGVMTSMTERNRANLLYFRELAASLPEWPWPFKTTSGFHGGKA